MYFLNLLIISEYLDNFVITLSVCEFHVRYSSEVMQRKSNVSTLNFYAIHIQSRD